MSIPAARTFQEFDAQCRGSRGRLRDRLRNGAVHALSLFKSVPRSNWLRAPFYHHVFDDERTGFAAHLEFMKNLGDFISMDDAVRLLESDQPLRGRYFCLSFDDAFRTCFTNGLPILLDYGAPAMMFVPTDFVASAPRIRDDFYPHVRVPVEFFSWDDCRAWSAAGLQLGSHTVHHVNTDTLAEAQVLDEFRTSKATLERELGHPCAHYSAPNGKFAADRDPRLAASAGFKTFSTTRRGSVNRKSTLLSFDRDHSVAAWSTAQLKYFFSA